MMTQDQQYGEFLQLMRRAIARHASGDVEFHSFVEMFESLLDRYPLPGVESRKFSDWFTKLELIRAVQLSENRSVPTAEEARLVDGYTAELAEHVRGSDE